MDEKRTILLVEDDYSVRSSLIQLLEANNYNTIAFADGESAIKVINLIRPDLIISDINLPGIDGYEVLKKVKAIFTTDDPVPFIYLTARNNTEDFRLGMNLGADDYITKPFDPDDILNSINVRLRKYDSIRHSNKGPQRLDKSQGIIISDKNKSEFIKVDDIAFISAAGDYSEVHLLKKKTVMAQKTLKKWEEILPGNIFYRTHRSYIVNINHIKEITPCFKRSFKVLLKDLDDEVFISERYVLKLKKLLLSN